MDHKLLDVDRELDCIDSGSVSCAVNIGEDTSVHAPLTAFLTLCVPPFLHLKHVQEIQVLQTTLLRPYTSYRSTIFHPTPRQSHSNNFLVSKHAIIRSVFIRLRTHAVGAPEDVSAQSSIRNDIYGSALLSAYEQANAFTRPLASSRQLPPELVGEKETLQSDRELMRIRPYKKRQFLYLQEGEEDKQYVKEDNLKRDMWSAAHTVLSVDKDSRTVAPTSSGAGTIQATIKYIGQSISRPSFDEHIRAANDELFLYLTQRYFGRFSTSRS